jgi:hypothetical protein
MIASWRTKDRSLQLILAPLLSTPPAILVRLLGKIDPGVGPMRLHATPADHSDIMVGMVTTTRTNISVTTMTDERCQILLEALRDKMLPQIRSIYCSLNVHRLHITKILPEDRGLRVNRCPRTCNAFSLILRLTVQGSLMNLESRIPLQRKLKLNTRRFHRYSWIFLLRAILRLRSTPLITYLVSFTKENRGNSSMMTSLDAQYMFRGLK